MKRIVFSVVLLPLLFAAAAAAQQNASLRGVVTKFYGEIVPQARVKIKLKSGRKKFTRKTETSYAGEYFFGDIPPGIYEISANSGALNHLNLSFEVLPNQTTKLDLTLEFGGDCVKSTAPAQEINDKQKARTVNQILKDIFADATFAELKTLANQKEGIVLSTDNLQIENIKPPKNVKFQLMSKSEISTKADEGTPYLYLSFGKFQAKGNCSVVTVTNSWAVGFNSKDTPTSGGGKVYVYRRNGSKLKLRSKTNWKF